jgi:uncharacterized membrane protein
MSPRRERRDATPRLDDLGKPRGTGAGPSYDPEAFGPAAERFARFFGTPTYLIWQTVLVGIWILFNSLAISFRWDPYPFILLNLVFSTQAAYAAPLILLAQNRQADREKAEMERDRERNPRALADMEFLGREIAGIRLSLESKADREDVTDALDRLTHALEQSSGLELSATSHDAAAEEAEPREP